MRFTYTKVEGFEPAIIGIRLNMSKDYEDAVSKMDSEWETHLNYNNDEVYTTYAIGPEDLRICKNLITADEKKSAGQPNSKFLQMIEVWVCVEAPLCFWKEADTYRHAVKSSTSTMHRINKYIIDETCFEPKPTNGKISSLIDIQKLEEARQKFNETHDKDIWYDLIYGLGDSWLQTRMWHFNYSTLRNICQWRLHHKQNTWSGDDNDTMENFITWAKKLPYADEFLFDQENKNGKDL